MFKVGDAVVISGGRAGREGDDDFITLKSGCYWWHGVIEDMDYKIEGWTRQLIRVRYGGRLGNFYTGQVHTESEAMKRINKKDVFQVLSEQMTPVQKKVARYTYDMSTDRIKERLQALRNRTQYALLLEGRTVDIVQEYNALVDVYRRRMRQGV